MHKIYENHKIPYVKKYNGTTNQKYPIQMNKTKKCVFEHKKVS